MVRTSLRGFREGLWEPGRQGPRAWAGQGLAGAGQEGGLGGPAALCPGTRL